MALPDLSAFINSKGYRITNRIGPMIDAAIDKHAGGDKVVWEPQLMPTQDGGAQVVVFVWMPGMVMGTFVQGSFALPDPIGVTSEDIDQIVTAFLTELRNARSGQSQQETARHAPSLRDVAGGVNGF